MTKPFLERILEKHGIFPEVGQSFRIIDNTKEIVMKFDNIEGKELIKHE